VSYRDRQAALSSTDTPKPGILVLIYCVSHLAIARLKNIFPFTAFSSTIIRFVGAAVSKLSVVIRFTSASSYKKSWEMQHFCILGRKFGIYNLSYQTLIEGFVEGKRFNGLSIKEGANET